jgi:hypothetical protein
VATIFDVLNVHNRVSAIVGGPTAGNGRRPCAPGHAITTTMSCSAQVVACVSRSWRTV